MNPELKALIEAVREWDIQYHTKSYPLSNDASTARYVLSQAYDAYQKSRATPPDGLPQAPSGMRWHRSEQHDHLKQSDPPCGLCWSTRDIVWWTLIDDPDADSFTKIADELEAVSRSGDHADYAKRIRALLEKQQ